MANKTLDDLFDMADGALDKLDAVLPDRGPPVNRQPPPLATPARKDTKQSWEETWDDEVWWSPVAVGDTRVWHAFETGKLSTVCEPDKTIPSHEILERQKLPYSRIINACTSCIIGVSHRG